MTQEKKPHVHAELIKAWADGEEIEYFNRQGLWVDCQFPSWYNDYKYRIKPRPIKTERYRRWISRNSTDKGFEYYLHTISIEDYGVDSLHNQPYFVRWVDKYWQEGLVVGDSNDND